MCDAEPWLCVYCVRDVVDYFGVLHWHFVVDSGVAVCGVPGLPLTSSLDWKNRLGGPCSSLVIGAAVISASASTGDVVWKSMPVVPLVAVVSNALVCICIYVSALVLSFACSSCIACQQQ